MGKEYEFFSEDLASYGNDNYGMSVENLQQLEVTGLPSSKLRLKLGAPAMLLRNLNQTGDLTTVYV